MRARSLVGAVGDVDDHGTALLSRRTLRGQPEVNRRFAATVETLSDVAALLDAGAPLPPRSTDPGDRSGTDERAVVHVLDVIYDRGRAPVAAVDDDVLSVAEAAGRVAVAGSNVIVPLARDGAGARNWRTVTTYLRDRVEATLEAFRRVAGRYDRNGTRDVRREPETVVAMLETLLEVLRQTASQGRFVLTQISGPGGASEREFAEWTIDVLDGDNHA